MTHSVKLVVLQFRLQ